jgi:hypothetical protein
MMCTSGGCRLLLRDEMPHTICLSPAGYRTDLQDSVCSRSRFLSLCCRALVSKTRTLPPPLAIHCSQAGLVVRPAPPVTLRRLVFPVSGHLSRCLFHNALHGSNDRRHCGQRSLPFGRGLGLHGLSAIAAAQRKTGSAASDRITPDVGAMPPFRSPDKAGGRKLSFVSQWQPHRELHPDSCVESTES